MSWVFEEKGLWGWAREIRRRKFDLVMDLHDTFGHGCGHFSRGAPPGARYDKRAADRRRLVWTKRVSPRLSGSVVDRYLETLAVLGVPSGDRIPKLYLGAEERLSEPLEKRLGPPGPGLSPLPQGPFISPNSGPERFAAAADRLAEGRPVVVLGTRADARAAEEVLKTLTSPAQSFVGQTSLREMMLILHRVVLCFDQRFRGHACGGRAGGSHRCSFRPHREGVRLLSPWGSNGGGRGGRGLTVGRAPLHGTKKCPRGHFRA
jgi:ADP-heptose:LPS heptosyltransferase